jgi:hypothetical protein
MKEGNMATKKQIELPKTIFVYRYDGDESYILAQESVADCFGCNVDRQTIGVYKLTEIRDVKLVAQEISVKAVK